jgi:hypothetical protein
MRTLIDARQFRTIYIVITERPYHSTGWTVATIGPDWEVRSPFVVSLVKAPTCSLFMVRQAHHERIPWASRTIKRLWDVQEAYDFGNTQVRIS